MSLIKILKDQESQWELQYHPIKVEDLNKPVEYWNEVADTFKDFLIDEIGFMSDWVQSFECRRRDGFIPYSSNKGGMKGYHYSDQLTHYFEPTGFEKFDDECIKTYNYLIDTNLEESNISKKDYENGIDNDNQEMLDFREEIERSFGEYESSYFETMLKIEDDNTLYVYFGLFASDAPYHRNADSSFDFEINFNSVNELKKKLYKLLDDDRVKTFISIVNY